LDISVFTDKKSIPNDNDLIEALGNTYPLWQTIKDYVHSKYPKAMDAWNYSGAKYGWSFRIKDQKRAILYLLPREKYFKVSFVFGQKATEMIRAGQISKKIEKDLDAAKGYAEGRGIRIDVNDSSVIDDIKKLIGIKLSS
jgi:hypothetical protein